MDVKQACEAVSANPIGRTKLRMVVAVVRLKFDMDPIDVGAPTPEVPLAETKTRLRVEGRATLKEKVSSIMDPSSYLEVERASREELRALRARFRSLKGEDPKKSEEITDDPMSVMSAHVKVGVAPCVDFGVWRSFGQRTANNLEFISHFIDNSGSWKCKEISSPSTWEACWRLFRTAAIMCDVAAPAVLDRYAARFRERVDRFSDAWCLCVLAYTRCGSGFWEAFGIQNCLRLSLKVHGTMQSALQPMIVICGKKS